MNYREFVEKHTGKTDMTLGYSFPLTKELVQAQAGMFRKIFSNKAVKQDMDDFVLWQLYGLAEMNDDAMRACFENGASKELGLDSLAKIVSGCTTEFSDITKDLMQTNGISMKDLHSALVYPNREHSEDTIIHCLNIGMAHKDVAELYTKENYLETLIAYDFSKEHIKSYMLYNHFNPFEPENNCAAQLLDYGFTANDLMDMTPNTAATFSIPHNCQVILELGATPEHIAESILFAGIERPDETVKILVANGIATEDFTDRYKGNDLDQFCEQLERIGVEPKFSEHALNEFSYTEFSYHSKSERLSERLFNEIDKTAPFNEDVKERFLLAAFQTFDNKAIDFLISKGVEINETHVPAMIRNISEAWGSNTDKLEKAAVDVIQNIAINHKYKLSPETQDVIVKQEQAEGLTLTKLRGMVEKVEFNQKLERKLPPKETLRLTQHTDQPIQTQKKKLSQTMKI